MAPVAQISLIICFIVMGMLRREINYIQGYLYRIQCKELQKYPVSVTVVEPHAYYCNLYLSISAPDTKTYFCCCGNAGARYSTVYSTHHLYPRHSAIAHMRNWFLHRVCATKTATFLICCRARRAGSPWRTRTWRAWSLWSPWHQAAHLPYMQVSTHIMWPKWRHLFNQTVN